MSLTKAVLIDNISDKMGFTKEDSRVLVDNFYAEISNSLVAATPVKLMGLGTFSVRDKSARPGLNPRTHEKVEISARRVVTFKVGERLKERLVGEN